MGKRRWYKNRNTGRITDYEILLKKLNIVYIYDDNYRLDSISDFISYNKKSKQLSLVDLIINQIIEPER